MSPILQSGKAALTVLLRNVELPASAICFTGDAIAALSNYTVRHAVINLDDWDWYEELRSGATVYIITNLKKTLVKRGLPE